MDLSKQKIKKARAWTKVKKRKLTVKFWDLNKRKNRWKMRRLWLASDATVLKSTEEDSLAEDATAQDSWKTNSTKNCQRCLRKKFRATLLKPSRDSWEIILERKLLIKKHRFTQVLLVMAAMLAQFWELDTDAAFAQTSTFARNVRVRKPIPITSWR